MKFKDLPITTYEFFRNNDLNGTLQFYGKSKKKMKPIMIEEMSAIDIYKQSRNSSGGREGRMGEGWFKIEPAPKDANKWRKKSSSIGGNKNYSVPHINRHGNTVVNGWIGKGGFNPHT